MAKFLPNTGIPVDFPGFLNPRIPKDVVVFFDDFLGASWSATADAAVWNYTFIATQASTPTVLDPTDEGVNMQVNGEAFHLDGGYPLYFETRVNAASIVDIDWFVGLSETDAEIITGTDSTQTNRLGFESIIGTTSFITSEASQTEKSTGMSITEAANDWIRLAFFWDGLKVHFSVDTNDDGEFEYKGYHEASTTADYVAQAIALTPTIEAIVAATGGTTLWVDYVLCMQQRFSK